MKKLFAAIVILSSIMSSMAIPTAMAVRVPFTDVSDNAWYYSDIKTAYKFGLIDGKTETKFYPDSYLTYGEAAKLAACMHQSIHQPFVDLTNGTPWYQTYVDYCKTHGIISKEYPWTQFATRAGYMEIFAHVLADDDLQVINDVSDGTIPDVAETHPQAEEIYKLYRAGIVTGIDSSLKCNPDANIKRCEVAAVLTRMMDDDARCYIQGTKIKPIVAALNDIGSGCWTSETGELRIEHDGEKLIVNIWDKDCLIFGETIDKNADFEKVNAGYCLGFYSRINNSENYVYIEIVYTSDIYGKTIRVIFDNLIWDVYTWASPYPGDIIQPQKQNDTRYSGTFFLPPEFKIQFTVQDLCDGSHLVLYVYDNDILVNMCLLEKVSSCSNEWGDVVTEYKARRVASAYDYGYGDYYYDFLYYASYTLDGDSLIIDNPFFALYGDLNWICLI